MGTGSELEREAEIEFETERGKFFLSLDRKMSEKNLMYFLI